MSAHETGGDHLGSKGIDSWRVTRPGKGPSDGNKHLWVIPILMQPHVREHLSRKTVTAFFSWLCAVSLNGNTVTYLTCIF